MKKNNEYTQKKGQKVGQIMGIKVNSTNVPEVLARVEDFISDNTKFSIVTPNPELILMAQKDNNLKNALNDADLAIPDGIGVTMAGKFLTLPVPKNTILKFIVVFLQGLKVGFSVFFNKKWLTFDLENIKGRELFMDLIRLADKKSWKVFLLGGMDDEAARAASNLKSLISNLKIESNKGPTLGNDAKPVTNADKKFEIDSIHQINSYKPELLFVAFGNPKQEIWIHENLSKLNVGGAMAVGGSFRYVAGTSRLPPKWMANCGLEWLWRLITEPVRIKRIFNAFPVFPLKIWMSKLR